MNRKSYWERFGYCDTTKMFINSYVKKDENKAKRKRRRLNIDAIIARISYVSGKLKFSYANFSYFIPLMEVVIKLPSKVREFVLKDCQFLSIAAGTVIHQEEITTKWLILISERVQPRDFRCTLAHEIAHAWLGHEGYSEEPEKQETEVRSLIKKWGYVKRK